MKKLMVIGLALPNEKGKTIKTRSEAPLRGSATVPYRGGATVPYRGGATVPLRRA